MDSESKTYGALCSLYYDATEGYASENEVSFFASVIQQSGGRALEAMSGSGRLQIPLLKKGLLVDGVDRSPDMLMRCRQRCHEEHVVAALYEQSLEELNLPHRYATVIIASGSFQLIVEREKALRALKALAAHMLPKGMLYIDIFIPDSSRLTRVDTRVRLDEHKEIHLVTRYVVDEKTQLADGICHYELFIDGRLVQREDELIEVVWYTPLQLEQLLSEAGFDFFGLSEHHFRECGPSLVASARKKE